MKIASAAIPLAALALVTVAGQASASDIEFRLVVDCTPGLTRYPSPFSDKKPICVSSGVIMSDANIVQVKPKHDKYVGGIVEFELDAAAQVRLTEVTQDHLGSQIALISQGKLITAAVIESPIRGPEMDLHLPDQYREEVLRIFQDRKFVK